MRFNAAVWLLASTAALTAIASPAQAQATAAFSIPAQPLSAALNAFSRATGLQVATEPGMLEGQQGNAVQGALSPEAGLRRLLAGTGVTGQIVGQTVILRRATKSGSHNRNGAADRPAGTARPPQPKMAAADASPDEITVTGSRVIDSITNSPTPVTVLTAERMDATTPSTVADALAKLPANLGGNNGYNLGGPVRNAAGTTLNLFGLGSNRTLVLLDGHRVPPANVDGSVDIDVLPTALLERVEVTTGGSSAVYGSDAISGVVNYILNKKFTGVTVDANGGISTFGDAGSWRASVTAGRDVFGGRGHIEGAFTYYQRPELMQSQRPYSSDGQQWAYLGLGTSASPYTAIQYYRINTSSPGGVITCTGCAANGQQFAQDGVIGAFDKGTVTATKGVSLGGDGTNRSSQYGFQAALRTLAGFGRFSYDLDDRTTFYVQGSVTQARNAHNYGSVTLDGTFFSNNAFLSPAAQAQLANSSGKFSISRYTTQIDDQDVNGDLYHEVATNRYLSGQIGMDGAVEGRFPFHLFYSYANARQTVTLFGDVNNQRLAAARDAVLDPSGKVVCEVSLTAYASLYPGCTPINAFGPGAVTRQQVDYVSDATWYQMTNTLHDLSADISGDIFQLPAGPVRVALSGEARWLSLRLDSPFSPTDTVDCTGLRLCTAGTALHAGSTVNSIPGATQAIQEIAGEAHVPILSDIPFIRQLSVDGAGRFTHYNTSGSVETWKAGAMWRISGDVAIRATRSRDIRAPNVNDLYAVAQVNQVNFTDLLTNTAVTIKQTTLSNEALRPEVSNALTAGIVLTPRAIPNLTISADYFRFRISQGIALATYSTPAIQQLCLASAPNYDSPFCALATRPIAPGQPGYTSSANKVTAITSQNVNVASENTEGFNLDVGYNLPLSRIAGALPGNISLEALATYQPYNDVIATDGAAPSWTPAPKARVTILGQYQVGSWTFSLQDYWNGRYSHLEYPGEVFVDPTIRSFNSLDISVKKTIRLNKSTIDIYANAQNILGESPPLFISTGGVGASYPINRASPGAAQYRYFTMGLRGHF